MSAADKLADRYASKREVNNMESLKASWARVLKDCPVASFPRFASPTYRPVGNATFEHTISLDRQAQSSFTTPTIIKAACMILLGLYSNANDIVIGLAAEGRTTSPFRTLFHENQLVHDLLAQIQNGAEGLEQLSLSEIEQIGPDAKVACDFRILLIVGSLDEKFTLSSALPLDRGLVLECGLASDLTPLIKLEAKATYDAHLLKELEVQQFLLQFEHIIQQLCTETPTLRISDVQSASPADLQQIFLWNATVPDASEHCVHDLIQSRASTSQDHPAICSWDGSLSYGELENLSSQLASQLAAQASIGPEVLVPICFEKSKWAVVAMLAVLKAGGACVPLSPAHPVSRLKTIIRDLGEACASIIVTSASNQQLFEGTKSTIIVDSSLFSHSSIEGSEITAPFSSRKVAPNNAAFIITTSGSTGKPKEILLEHSAVCTSARDHGEMIKLGSHSRVLQFAAYTFDICISDMFVTLIHGGTICIPSEHDRMNNLAGAIQKLNANHMSITASVVSHLSPQDLKSLKVLIVAGEAMTRDVVDKWAEHVTLINMYGPGQSLPSILLRVPQFYGTKLPAAECTVYSIGKPDIRPNDDASLIGKGVGSRVWITKEEDPNVLVPIGTVGEILIEGPVLARKYLNDEDGRTKCAFLRDPAWVHGNSSETSSRRFYRTGDLARYTMDGLISFVGRKDDGQIKLRGQRIEPGEVE